MVALPQLVAGLNAHGFLCGIALLKGDGLRHLAGDPHGFPHRDTTGSPRSLPAPSQLIHLHVLPRLAWPSSKRTLCDYTEAQNWTGEDSIWPPPPPPEKLQNP